MTYPPHPPNGARGASQGRGIERDDDEKAVCRMQDAQDSPQTLPVGQFFPQVRRWILVL